MADIQRYFAEFTRFNHEKDDYETARALLVADNGGNLVLHVDHIAQIEKLREALNGVTECWLRDGTPCFCLAEFNEDDDTSQHDSYCLKARAALSGEGE